MTPRKWFVSACQRPGQPASLAVPALALLLALSAAPARANDLKFHGLLDFTLSGTGPAFDYNALTHGDTPFDAYGLRMFGEGAVGEHFQVFTQGVFHDHSGMYIEGAYVTYTPLPERDLHVEVGKIPFPVGTYAPRSYSDKNPLIGKPLMYQHHTTLLWYYQPSTADALLAVAGGGQEASSYAGPGSTGMPIVDDSYWDTGIVAIGSLLPLEIAAGLTTGTPGWGNTSADENHSKTAVARIGVAPIPSLRVGVSGAYGAYVVEALNEHLPAGTTADDYHQKLAMADAEFELGHLELRAEGYHNTWQTAHVGDLKVKGGYMEGQFALFPGAWLAARGEAMRFSELTDSKGAVLPWDHDRDRLEIGLGYRPERTVWLKAAWQRNVEKFTGTNLPNEIQNLLALQMTLGF